MAKKKSTNSTPKKAITRNREWKPIFIDTLRVTGNILASCKSASIDRRTAYDHRKKDEKFAEQWNIALEDACDTLEAAAWQRARNGVKREHTFFYKGKVAGKDIITEYSDTLLIFLLKAHRPEKYRERFSVDVNYKHQFEIFIAANNITKEQIEENPVWRLAASRWGVMGFGASGVIA